METNILDQLNKGNANVEAVKSQLFEVINVPLFTNQDLFTPPNAFGIYKTTGGEPTKKRLKSLWKWLTNSLRFNSPLTLC